MGKVKSIIEAGKRYAKPTAQSKLECLMQGTQDINDLYKPSDKISEVKKKPNLQDSMKKAISNISDEYRRNDETLKEISKSFPEDTTKLRTDISWENQSSVKKLKKQLKDITPPTPQDQLENSFEKEQFAGVAKTLGITAEGLREKVKRNQRESNEPTKNPTQKAPESNDGGDPTLKNLHKNIDRLYNPNSRFR